eukprot:g18871.t1
MVQGLPVPQYYVMPQETFCRTLGNSLGVNVAEFEFPAYYNFFLKGQTVKLIVDSLEAENRIRALMQETLLGPEEIDATTDFDPSVPMGDRPDIAKELSYFRSFNGKELSVDLLITFLVMDSEGVVTINGAEGTPGADCCVTIAASDSNGGEYIITEHQRVPHAPGEVDVDGGNGDGNGDDGRATPGGEKKAPRFGKIQFPARCDDPGDRMISGSSSNPDDFEVRPAEVARHRPGDSATMLKADTIAQHLKVDVSEVGSGDDDGGEGSEDSEEDGEEELLPAKKGSDASSDREQQKPRQQRQQREREQQPGSPRGGKGRDRGSGGGEGGGKGGRWREEEEESRKDDGSDVVLWEEGGGSRSDPPERKQPRFTPTPPRSKSASPSLEEGGGGSGPSVAKRFAKWIVQSAHIAGKRRGGGGPDNDPKRSPRENRGGGGASGGVSAAAAGDGGSEPGGEGDQPQSRPLGVRRPRPAHVRGFVPVREGHVSMTCPLPSRLPFHPDQTEEEFDAPTFGTTVLGNSHGFDPNGSTSGYVLWVNGRGYMIDPPPYASMILQAFNIRPSLIAGVIVTHCHADHDAGTFQKVLLDGQVNIISTRTIYESFIRKYTALSGMNSDLIRTSHKFTPVTIGQSLRLNGASFNFFYTLHSIPCIGFEVTLKGKGMSFSADHMNDPARIHAMCEEGFMSEGRRDALLDFPWHHDAIFHEAGIPPIHTPMKTLKELPDDVKKRLYVVHVSESSIPKGSGLQVAPAGVENTIRLETEVNPHSEAIALLELICSVGILKDISVEQARSLLEVGRSAKFKANTSIQHRNTDITDFAIICHGRAVATVIKEPGARRSFSKRHTVLRRGDCYGEELLLEGSVRRKSAVQVAAVTDIEVILFNGQDLDHIFGLKTKILEDTYRLDRLLVYNSVLSSLSRKQTLQLETFIEVKKYVAGEMVWIEGEPVEKVVLVAKGKLSFIGAGTKQLMSGYIPPDGRRMIGGERPRLVCCPKQFLPGSMIGRAGTLLDLPGSNHYKCSLQAVAESVVLVVSREDMAAFSYSNPGVFMAIHDLQMSAMETMLRAVIVGAIFPFSSELKGAAEAFVTPPSAVKPAADGAISLHRSGRHPRPRLPQLHQEQERRSREEHKMQRQQQHHHQQQQQRRPQQRPAHSWPLSSSPWDTTSMPDDWQHDRQAWRRRRRQRRRSTRRHPWTSVSSSGSGSGSSSSGGGDGSSHSSVVSELPKSSDDAEEGGGRRDDASSRTHSGGGGGSSSSSSASSVLIAANTTTAATPKTSVSPLPAALAPAPAPAATAAAAAVAGEEGAPLRGAVGAVGEDAAGDSDSNSDRGTDKGKGKEGDGFGEHGWYSPSGAAQVGMGSLFSWADRNSSSRSAPAESAMAHQGSSQSEALRDDDRKEQDSGADENHWSERRRLVEEWEDHDEVWISMRQEARAAAEKEPLLVSFVYSTILNQKTLEAAVAFHLANKLAGPHMLSTQVQALVREYFADVGTPFRRHLRRDIIAVRERDPACDSYHDCLLYFKGFQALQTHRVAHWLYHSGRHALAFYLQSQVNQEFQIDIHPAAKFGEGVFIDHGTGIVVGETAVIGDDVSMLHRVTLGGSGVKSADRHPKIGNGVLIGAGACLLGNINVGKGTQIGAGSLVVTDLPERCVAVGVPAKVLGKGKRRKPALAMDQDCFKDLLWRGLDI